MLFRILYLTCKPILCKTAVIRISITGGILDTDNIINRVMLLSVWNNDTRMADGKIELPVFVY